jgi:DNA repair protein RadC
VCADDCKTPREDDPARTPYGAALAVPAALLACERTPGAGDTPAAGHVLTHPAFDRPPVPNERRPDRKAGAVSLAAARRRKAAEAGVIEPDGPAPGRGRIEPPMRGPGAASAGAAAHLVRQTAEALDRDARGLAAPDRAVIDAALSILGRHLRTPGALFDSPGSTRDFLRLHLAGWDRERFAVLFLDGQHRLIELETLFEGTLTQTSVYPRDVARRALHWNAAAVILAHNHPSGVAEPSRADEYLTDTLRRALALLDVRVLDHLVIGWPDVVSLAERGLM